MESVLIGVDAGTTNLKAAAFALDGTEVHQEAMENPVKNPESGWVEQELEGTWERTSTIIERLVSALDDEYDILGVGVTGQGDGVWLVDEEGKPARDAILWSDGRAADIVTRWQDDGTSEEIREITGSDLFPGSPLAILKWLVENEPETIEAAETVFFCKDWLKLNLTGEVTSDYTGPSRPFLDIETLEYDDDILEITGLQAVDSLRPRLEPPTEIIGTITPEAAAQTGLDEDTPVISGIIDTIACPIGSGAATSGDSQSIVGTTAINQTILNEPPETFDGTGFTMPIIEGLYTRQMASMAGTPNIDWSYEHIASGADFAEVEAEMETLPVGSDGVLYLPYLSSSGERSPFVNADARAEFIGLSPEHTQAHLMRAIYEGVALAMRDNYEHIATESDRLIIGGGGARSAFWCQVFADCLDTPVFVPDTDEVGAKGVALLLGIAVGEFDGLEDAVEKTTGYTDQFDPDPDRAAKYDRWYDFFRSTSRAMFDVWDDRVTALDDLS